MPDSQVLQLPGTEAPKSDDPLAATDELGHSARDYQAIASSFNDDMRSFTRRWLRECLDSVLLRYDDPKGYSELHTTVVQVVDAVMLYLISEGYLVATEKALDATDAIEKRVREWEESYRRANEAAEARKAMLSQLGGPGSGTPQLGGMYL